MSRIIRLFIAALAAFTFCSCSSTGSTKVASSGTKSSSVFSAAPYKKADGTIYRVKTTAYCHKESDSLRYGRGSATGNALKYGTVRSAAADWSVFPVGTIFKIQGETVYYQVDDYGRALVGTKTIDLYRPSMAEMKAWGARKVNIEVVRWGSFEKSLSILKDRTRHAHVKMMYTNIIKKNRKSHS